jgi:Ca-activated chloride channel family protein
MRWLRFLLALSLPFALAVACTLDRGRSLSTSGGYAPLGAFYHTEEPGPDWNTERYDFVEEEGFLSPLDHPLSTFSIDVDTASYSNVRRFLSEGQLPPDGAVRIEELLNYFSYDYVADPGEHPFAVTTELTQAPWQPEHHLLLVGLQGVEIDERDIPPRNLVFLLDVSGSMQPADRLPLVKRALRELVLRLRPQDRVAVVVYAGASGLVLPPTSGSERGRILDALERLQAGGSTNGGEGIVLAYRVARQHFDAGSINRVILATDGDFNVGVTSRSELVERIEIERESGVFLSVLGVGRGNLNDAGMEELADHGNGNYAYLDGLAEAKKVLVEEAGGTLVTIAKDVKLQVEFNPGRVAAYRLIGYENRRLEDRDFNDDKADAGEIGAGHSVTALYEIVPAGVAADTGALDPLVYQRPPQLSTRAGGDEWLTLKLRYKPPAGSESRLIATNVSGRPSAFESASENVRFAGAVALFGMLLRSSEHLGEGDFVLARELALSALGDDPEGRRAEFAELVAQARDLDAGTGLASRSGGASPL